MRYFQPFQITAALLALLLQAQASAASFPGGQSDNFDFRYVVNSAKEKVFPSVVFLKCLRQDMQTGNKISQEVSGSGVIISKEGEILTNWHLVDKAIQVRCLLYDGRALDAKVLGADKDTDIALLKLEVPQDSKPPLPSAALGSSAKLSEGDFVMALGAPWGLTRSVSIGIISCTKRFLPEASEYSCWLQTDAAISPGNSGGPLVNTSGEIIGINARGIMVGGDTGFAVPIDVALAVASQIRQYGKVSWTWTGLELQPLKDFNRNIYFNASEGVIVAETQPGSPARNAKLLPGDRIIKINGQTINGLTEEDLPAIRRLLGLLPKGTPAKIDLERQGEKLSLELIPAEKGMVEGEELAFPRWDLTAKAINQFDTPELFYLRPQGIFVYGVKAPGNAQMAGLLPQDIILKIDTTEINNAADISAAYKAAMDKLDTKPRVVISVMRGGMLRQIVLDFSRNFQKE